MTRRYLPLLLLATIVLLNAAGCGGSGGVADVAAGRPIVVVSVDTLRSDRLPAYGYDRVETPAIDALRADGILFERAYSPVPMTLPAHASILTGLLPPAHGVRDNAGYRLEETAGPTVPELLGRAGYATGAAVSAYVLRRETGIARGFDHYDDRVPEASRTLMGDLQRPGDETLAAALEWLDGLEAGKPFFLLLHIYEPHTPREPPEPYASRYSDPYDGEVAWSDAIFGRIVAALTERGLYQDSTVVFLSDHGEGLDDHGEDEHGILLYRESLQVPLVLKLPGGRGAGTTEATPVDLTDVAPTLLALAGVEVPEALPGTSLLRLAAGDRPPEIANRALYSETFHPQLRFGWSGLRSVIRGRHQYVEGVDRELYDLIGDPAERHNLVRGDRRTYAALRDALAGFDSELAPPFEESTETREALATLGYLGSTTTAEGPLADPKQGLAALAPLRRGIALVHEHRCEEAIPLLTEATAAVPRSVDAWQFLGLANQETGHMPEAFEAYRKAFELSNGAPHLAQPLAEVALRLEKWSDAAVYLGLAVEESPDDLRLRFLQTRALLFAGELDQALESAELTAAAAPQNPDAHYQLGAVRMGRREVQGAESELRRALDLAPDHPAALSDLAVLLASQGRRGEAAALLERLVRIQPENRAARENLARLRAAGG
jgi:arylsulfatase A-like enzyme/cytochrome c-type biogenesis protein CcmH/NrfG